MNTHPSRPPNASDFDLKSSDSARAQESARERGERALEEDYAQSGGDYQFENSAPHEARSDAEFEGERQRPMLHNANDNASARAENRRDNSETEEAHIEESEAEELEIDELEIEQLEADELEADDLALEEKSSRPESRNNSHGERDEDYAEFERVFVQWKETGDPRLRERLILMNRSMVMFLARRFMDRGELFEDVLQVGMLGLIYALDGYDMKRGVKFSTFAIPTISGEIRRYFRDKVSGMRVPRGLQELHSTLQTRIEELTQQLDRSPTYAEIAFSLKIEVEQVVEAMELGAAIDPLSIDDRFFGEESATIAESIGAPDPQLHAYEEHAALQTALEKLPAQERRVLEMSYFDGHSQAEIARRLNVSQMHISRLLRRSLAQLKQLLEEV